MAARPPEGLIGECARAAAPHRVVPELLRCQAETNSAVTKSVREAGAALRAMRAAVRSRCAVHGLDAIAVSSHPWAEWEAQHIVDAPRYRRVEAEMQDVVRRYFVSGMHVHAGFGDAEERIAVMRRLRGELPLLLALSTSSVFHAGRMTGLKSFRAQITASLPRSGAPPATRELGGTGGEHRAGTGRWARWRTERSCAGTSARRCATRRSSSACATHARAQPTRWPSSRCTPASCDEALEAHRAGAPEPACMDEALVEGRWRAARYGAFAELPRARERGAGRGRRAHAADRGATRGARRRARVPE